MKQNNMLAMILAGGRGSRLHELTNKVAKPAAILFFFNPAHKPSGIAKIKDIANAVPINISVAGRRSPIISVTGLLFFNEIPRSP